jgi:ribosome-associated toxin RatA of RatAB toxin-antitoxin module
MKNINLNTKWIIRAPLAEVFNIMTDFEKWPEYFPKVAKSLRVIRHEGNNFEMAVSIKSFGQDFPAKMKTQILPGKRIHFRQ